MGNQWENLIVEMIRNSIQDPLSGERQGMFGADAEHDGIRNVRERFLWRRTLMAKQTTVFQTQDKKQSPTDLFQFRKNIIVSC